MQFSDQHNSPKDSKGSRNRPSESEVNNNKKRERAVLFHNTQEAVA